MPIYFVDDTVARAFQPFALTRPACALRAGALLLHERWALLGESRIDGFIGAEHLVDFSAPDGIPPYVAPDTTLRAGSVIVNARCIPAFGSIGDGSPLREGHQWTVDGRLMAVRLTKDLRASEASAALDQPPAPNARAIAGRWMNHPWDYISGLPTELNDDIPALIQDRGASMEPNITSVGSGGLYAVYVEDGAVIEPHVVFDLRSGPVLISRGATVRAFTRVDGPLYVGPHSTVAGGRVSMCAIGPQCRVHGELSQTIVAGYTNKAHDGFVGHSYLGYWVNLGAGTITSNLKNTYGPIQMWTPDGMKDTGMTFLGSLIGDYARTAIGSRLNTGSVLGAGSNVVADGLVGKTIPPFVWHTSADERHKLFQMDNFSKSPSGRWHAGPFHSMQSCARI